MERTFLKVVFVAFAVATIPLAGCESAGGDISVLSSAPITPGATYAWTQARSPEEQDEDPRVDNDIIRERITVAVDSSLATKGFRRVEPSQAQYLVAYDVHLEDRTEYEYDTWFIRGIDYVKSTMMLDITDRSTGRLVWRATSQKRVDKHDETQEGLNAILADIVKTLPRLSSTAWGAPGR